MGQIIGQWAGAAPPALGDLFICDFPWAAPKDDMASMEHPLFTLATRPDRRILRYAHGEATIEVTPSVKGLATIHDKDVLIYCVSQLMAALNEGRPTSPELHLKAHDLLLATSREASGDGYRRLREALERLSGTRIVTNIATGGIESTRGFGGRSAANGGSRLCGLSGARHSFARSFGPRVAAPSGFIGSRKAGHFYHRTR